MLQKLDELDQISYNITTLTWISENPMEASPAKCNELESMYTTLGQGVLIEG